MDFVCSLAIHYLGKRLSISREVQELQVSALAFSSLNA